MPVMPALFSFTCAFLKYKMLMDILVPYYLLTNHFDLLQMLTCFILTKNIRNTLFILYVYLISILKIITMSFTIITPCAKNALSHTEVNNKILFRGKQIPHQEIII